MAAVANIVGPDLVLDANDANPAYVAGALCGLEVPFVVTFGNHRAPEPATWFGDPVDIVDFGTEFCVLNFGRPWDSSIADADQLLAARGATRTKIINAFESNAPIAGFLDRHRVALLHYAHGPGPHVAKMGATPTIRVGKVNSESFRIIRFRDGRPVSYTYRGDPVAPMPFAREAVAPIRVSYQPANDGTHAGLSATVQNDLAEPLPHARVVFVLPKGKYEVEGGTVESCADSDDGRFSVLTARGDVPSQAAHTLRVR